MTASCDLLAVVDMATGRMTALNDAWTDVLGWSRDELMERPYLDFVHPDDLHPTVQQDNHGRATGDEVMEFTNRWRCADGSYRRLVWSATVHNGQWVCVVKEARGPTWQARDAELAATLASSIADGLLVISPAGSVLYANPAALRCLGFRAEQLIGRDAHEVLHDGCPPDPCPLAAKPARGTVETTHDGWFAGAAGRSVPVSYSAAPIALGGGLGKVVVFRDVTRQLEEQSEREEAASALRRSEALHRTLVAW